MTVNTIIAGLPAILGAAVLVIFQILKQHGKGDRITEKILGKLRKEDAGTAEKYKKAGPKALAQAIEHDHALSKLKEGNDYQLLRQALQQQFIISLLVYTLSVIAIVVGIWLFIVHQRDLSRAETERQQIESKAKQVESDAETERQRIAVEAKRAESDASLAKQVEEMQMQVLALTKIISERPQSDAAGHPAPLDAQSLQKTRELEAKLVESEQQIAAYKSHYGDLPKSLDTKVLQDATNTIAKVRAIGDRLGFMTACAAEQNLSPAAKQQISLLLDGHRISDPEIVNWANQLKMPGGHNPEAVAIKAKYPKFANWHFIDIPIGSDAYDEAQSCPEGQCLIAKASEFIEVVQNKSIPLEERKIGIKWLVSLIGDLHRPLHCADRNKDLGGNLVKIVPINKSLHLLWDLDFPRALASEDTAEAFAVKLNGKVTEQQRSEWSKGTPKDWAWESFKIAGEKVYGPLPPAIPRPGKPSEVEATLPDGYEDKAKAIVEKQIQKGGVRLAWILNSAFGTP